MIRSKPIRFLQFIFIIELDLLCTSRNYLNVFLFICCLFNLFFFWLWVCLGLGCGGCVQQLQLQSKVLNNNEHYFFVFFKKGYI